MVNDVRIATKHKPDQSVKPSSHSIHSSSVCPFRSPLSVAVPREDNKVHNDQQCCSLIIFGIYLDILISAERKDSLKSDKEREKK